MGGRLHITKVTEEGQPIALENVARKFVSQYGTIVRDNVPISIREWKGRCRGFGVVLWKFAFRRDIDTYRNRKRRKEQQEESWRHMLEAKVHSQEVKMQEEINRRVALAVTKMAQSRALPDPNVVISPSQRRSNCASIGDNQRYPMDDIIQCTSCEMYRAFGNITIKVAYESALPILPGQTSHGMEVPPGYSSVRLDQICDSQYEGLELDLPRGDGERALRDALHGIIIWHKRYIIIPNKENSRPSSPAHPPPGPSSPPGPSHPARSLSPSPSNPGGASDDNQNTPPRSPSLGLKSSASKEPAAPLKKSRPPPSNPRQPKAKEPVKKTKKSEPIQKLASDMTSEEL
uniref:DUF8039 domain-containing protein n=1 Tax=Setaria viridis TaxID=4556 RepID=A0A4V6D863_SETVI|nr:hypothetical protein SEVIR_4G115600v2 [Setaria viridis]